MQTRFGDHTLSDLFVPDQYGFDHCGRRVLIGLSFRETCEFESLDLSLPFEGECIWPAAGGEIARFPKERRWQELWTKHRMCRTSNAVIVD